MNEAVDHLPAHPTPRQADRAARATGRIDVHTHLLPGVDDGCPTVDDSIQCARLLVDAGYTHAFCTPHVWPQLPGNTAARIPERVHSLQAAMDRANVPLTVLPGGEINLLWTWPALAELRREDIVTYGMDGRFVLFDFWAETAAECFDCLEAAVRHLMAMDLRLVLGHPERIAALHGEQWPLDRLSELGVLFQMNTWCLTDPPASPTYRVAERLLRAGRYFLLGTDLHNAASMPNRIRGLKIAEALVGPDEVRRLTVTNPRMLLAGQGLQ
jgi:protein-tyrosine phosphatase